jgi:hypothetical protein
VAAIEINKWRKGRAAWCAASASNFFTDGFFTLNEYAGMVFLA